MSTAACLMSGLASEWRRWYKTKIDIDRFQRQLEQRVRCSKPGSMPAACYKDVLDMLTAEINTQTMKSFREKKG